MVAVTITLAVFSIILIIILSSQDDRDNALVAENKLLKRHLEALQESGITTIGQAGPILDPLSENNIKDAIISAGYNPEYERDSCFINFRIEDVCYSIDIAKLPVVSIYCDYLVIPKDYDMEALRKAAHQMSDDLIMVKALFHETTESATLRFLVVAIEQSYVNFSDNLPRYITLIQTANDRMGDLYNHMEEEKRTVHLANQVSTFHYDA